MTDWTCARLLDMCVRIPKDVRERIPRRPLAGLEATPARDLRFAKEDRNWLSPDTNSSQLPAG